MLFIMDSLLTIKEGYKYEDFTKVIDTKYAAWIDSNYSCYLRPETLFGSKFESYLKAPAPKGKASATPISKKERI